MTRPHALLAVALLLLAASPFARGDPVSLGASDDAEAEIVAVSLSGNATCTSSACVALSPMGDARGGCRNATACEDTMTDCGGFVCFAAAVSVLGDARAYAYCDRFGQACVALAIGQDPTLYVCYGDVTTANYCRGFL